MVLLSLLAAILAVRTEAAQTETLYEAPARFWDHLPIVTFRVSGAGSGSQSMRFLIDSGANRSFLFPSTGMSTGLKTASLVVHIGSRMVVVGDCEFASVSAGKMSPEGAALMRRLGVAGSLGVDFLSTHDVLIDSRRSEVFVSREMSTSDEAGARLLLRRTVSRPGTRSKPSAIDLSQLRASSVDLVQQDELFFAPASVITADRTVCLMALDTGTGESAMPMEIASKLKPTGVRRELVGFQGRSASAREYRGKISIADNAPLLISVLGSDARGPILGGNAFESKSLFLQLRLSSARYW
jgi:hypothetical protein